MGIEHMGRPHKRIRTASGQVAPNRPLNALGSHSEDDMCTQEYRIASQEEGEG